MAAAAEAARGRHADRSQEIPPRGWLDIAKRVKNKIQRDQLSIVAAGVAFYGLLAVFPGLVALVGFYGLLVEPAQVEQHVSAISHMLPPQAADLLLGQLHDLATTDRAALGIGAIGGLLLALWSASSAVRTLMEALNVAYHEEESRGTIRWRWVTCGAAIAVALWIIGSALFSLYVTRFGNYNETYGAAGAVVILLMWKDTTSGRDRPMGARRAYAADTVAEGST